MAEWAETCSLAAINKPISAEKIREIKHKMQFIDPDKEENTVHDGAGHTVTERRQGYAGEQRNRREDIRIGDISRAVDKVVPESIPGGMLRPLEVEPKLKDLLNATHPSGFDKNTPGSLKNLRWAIYEMIDSYSGDICKLLRMTLQQRVEELFKEYTES